MFLRHFFHHFPMLFSQQLFQRGWVGGGSGLKWGKNQGSFTWSMTILGDYLQSSSGEAHTPVHREETKGQLACSRLQAYRCGVAIQSCCQSPKGINTSREVRWHTYQTAEYLIGL